MGSLQDNLRRVKEQLEPDSIVWEMLYQSGETSFKSEISLMNMVHDRLVCLESLVIRLHPNVKLWRGIEAMDI